MDYAQDIIGRLLDRYERSRGGRAITVDIPRSYPEYCNPHSELEATIANAIEALILRGLVHAVKNQRGYYGKVVLESSSVQAAFTLLGRTPKQNLQKQQMALLQETADRTTGAVRRFCLGQRERLQQGALLEFGLDKDLPKLQCVLLALEKLMQLTAETYIRNFQKRFFMTQSSSNEYRERFAVS